MSPLEPRSLKWPHADAAAKAWRADKANEALLATTARPDEIDPAEFDAIYFTGGHAVMWDYPDDAGCSGSRAKSTSAAASCRRSVTAIAGC